MSITVTVGYNRVKYCNWDTTESSTVTVGYNRVKSCNYGIQQSTVTVRYATYSSSVNDD